MRRPLPDPGLPLGERLAKMAAQAREEARHLPPGPARDALLMEAHRAAGGCSSHRSASWRHFYPTCAGQWPPAAAHDLTCMNFRAGGTPALAENSSSYNRLSGTIIP